MGSAGSGWKKATERTGQQESLLSQEGKEEGFFFITVSFFETPVERKSFRFGLRGNLVVELVAPQFPAFLPLYTVHIKLFYKTLQTLPSFSSPPPKKWKRRIKSGLEVSAFCSLISMCFLLGENTSPSFPSFFSIFLGGCGEKF